MKLFELEESLRHSGDRRDSGINRPNVWSVGDKVRPEWESGNAGEAMEIVDVKGSTITVKDDWGNIGTFGADALVRADESISESNQGPIVAARELINNAPTGDDVVAELPDLIAQYAGHPLIAGIKEIMNNFTDASEITLLVDDLIAHYESTRDGIEEAEYEGGIDFEPDAAFAGVKGVTTATGAGEKGAKDAQHKIQGEKVNAHWVKLLKAIKSMPSDNPKRKELAQNLKQMAAVAKKQGFELSPPAEKVFGLQSN